MTEAENRDHRPDKSLRKQGIRFVVSVFCLLSARFSHKMYNLKEAVFNNVQNF